MNGTVGGLDWADCYHCRYRRDNINGGCRIENLTNLTVNLEDETVECDKFIEK